MSLQENLSDIKEFSRKLRDVNDLVSYGLKVESWTIVLNTPFLNFWAFYFSGVSN